MTDWEKEFSKKMDSLHEQSSACLNRFLQEDLQAAFDGMASFLAKWKYHTSTPQSPLGRRLFKFALTEDAYVIVTFRLDGVDTLDCESEYGLPGVGRAAGARWSSSLRRADRTWGENCFQKALDGLVTKLAEADAKKKHAEPVLV